MNIIFIHGVGDQKEGYSKCLFENIINIYAENHSDIEPEEIRKKIQHKEVLWEELTEELTEEYLKLEYGPKLNSVWGLAMRYSRIDPIVIQILYYIKDKYRGYGQKGKLNILKSIHENFTDIHKNGDKTDIIVAHSLGSVIAFDYVFKFKKYKYESGATLKALFTLGSPIPIFTTAMNHVESNLKLPRNIKKWINILDKDDGIGRYCQPFFKKNIVQDIEVNTSGDPLTSHLKYWQNEETARIIAEEIGQI